MKQLERLILMGNLKSNKDKEYYEALRKRIAHNVNVLENYVKTGKYLECEE